MVRRPRAAGGRWTSEAYPQGRERATAPSGSGAHRNAVASPPGTVEPPPDAALDCPAARSVAARAPEAIAALDRLPISRLERNLCGTPASAARGGIHLTWTSVVSAAAVATSAVATFWPRGLARGPAGAASLRFGESPLGVEVLLARGEFELLVAVGADQNLVRVHENLELLSVAAPSVSSRRCVRGPVVELPTRSRPARELCGGIVRLALQRA